jgi:uncharacterized membrane protein YdjX (TVP38/TMEM64 family)
MRRLWLVMLAVLLALLAGFGLAHALGLRWLTDEAFVQSSLTARGPLWAGVIGVGLLVGDVVLPVVSSAIMLAHGWLFGVWGGTALNLLGSVACGIVGMAIGRLGGPWLNRLLPASEAARARALLARHGLAALIFTRPVPLLAETLALAAGAGGLPWRRALPALVLGCLPPSLLYAMAGAWQAPGWGSNVGIFLLVMALTGIAWFLGRPIKS